MSVGVCDSGPLIALAKLHQLHLLNLLYARILIPQPVYVETVTEGARRGAVDAHSIQAYIGRFQWEVIAAPVESPPHLSTRLGTGEQAAISLALTVPGVTLLLDDELARSSARQLGLTMRGTIGVLIEAYRRNHLTWEQTDLFLEELATRPDIWIGYELVQRVRTRLAQERERC